MRCRTTWILIIAALIVTAAWRIPRGPEAAPAPEARPEFPGFNLETFDGAQVTQEELAGKTVKCPMCTRPLMVPTPGIAQAVTKQIEVTCSCGQEFVAKPDLAGKTVKCSACGAALVIPNPVLN